MQSSTASHFSPPRLPQSYTAFNSFLHNSVATFTDYDPWEPYIECDFAEQQSCQSQSNLYYKAL